MNYELNFENTEIGRDVMLIDVAPGDLIYEVDGSNKMMGKVKRIGYSNDRYELFVEVYDSTAAAQIGETQYLFHAKGAAHYGPKLFQAKKVA